MPKVNITILHNLSAEEALKRARTILGEVKNEYADKISDLHEEWDGNTGSFSFSAKDSSISGTLTVKEKEVVLSANLPFRARFVPERIEKIKSIIRERAETLLA